MLNDRGGVAASERPVEWIFDDGGPRFVERTVGFEFPWPRHAAFGRCGRNVIENKRTRRFSQRDPDTILPGAQRGERDDALLGHGQRAAKVGDVDGLPQHVAQQPCGCARGDEPCGFTHDAMFEMVAALACGVLPHEGVGHQYKGGSFESAGRRGTTRSIQESGCPPSTVLMCASARPECVPRRCADVLRWWGSSRGRGLG